MPQTIVNFIKGDRHGSETDYRDLLPVNMCAISRPMFGTKGYMLQAEGLTQYGSGSGIDRRGIWNERFKNHFRVSGTDFIEVDENGASTVLGTIPGTDTVSLPYSFNTQAIIADGKYYLYDTTLGFRQVTDPDLGNPIDGLWVDGYYFFTDGENIYHTDIGNESSIDPLKFATAEFMPDDSLGLGKTVDNKVMVFGRYTTEYFVNVATANFAFQRLPTRAVKVGIVGTHAKCESDGRWFILGGPKEAGVGVHVIGAGSANRVSTREIDKIIGGYSETQLASSVLESRTEDGYTYIYVHLPNETLLFNETIARSLGAEHGWTILKTGTENVQWRAKFGMFEPRLGNWIYGDKQGPELGILDETVATQYDEIAEWVLNTPFMEAETASIEKLEIETIPGFTNNNDATVFVSLTYNGVTYGHESTEDYGEPNNYGKRLIFRNLGDVSDWFGVRLRGATRSRMAFGRGFIEYE